MLKLISLSLLKGSLNTKELTLLNQLLLIMRILLTFAMVVVSKTISSKIASRTFSIKIEKRPDGSTYLNDPSLAYKKVDYQGKVT